MEDPFRIHTDAISDRSLGKIAAKRWVEETAPEYAREVAYLRPSLRRPRLRAAMILCFGILFLLLARSAQLQIADTSAYLRAAQQNRLRIAQIPALRGIISDRNGIPLTRNVPRFQMVLYPADLPRAADERESMLTRIAKSAAIPLPEIRARLEKLEVPFGPLVLRHGLILPEVYPLIIAAQDIPGITIEPVSVREYPYGEILGHVLGYLGPIDASSRENYLRQGYALNEYVGKTGLEFTFENSLRGTPGRRYVEVDARGAILTTAALDESVAGKTARLTIDYELQRASYEALEGGLARVSREKGAVIVLEPKTGEILALVSYPSFDNNLFTAAADSRAAAQLLTNPAHPLFPRAISGAYPSGSAIKPAIAAAALQERVIEPRSAYLSAGGLRVSQWFFPDWKAGGHGLTDVRKALAESVNTFFYIIGGGYNDLSGLGIEKLADYLGQFGFGKLTGIEIPGEAAGLVATPQWKEEVKKEQWYIGDTYHMAIGQGDLLVTPLQISRMTAYFASGGEWAQPRIVMESLNHENIKSLDDAGPQIDPAHIQVVREGLRDAVRYGSARSLQALPATSAGKTGTAQWSSTKEPHAWFTGWAPYESPEIVVTVLIEEGKEGSSAATPVAREIFEWWFDRAQEH